MRFPLLSTFCIGIFTVAFSHPSELDTVTWHVGDVRPPLRAASPFEDQVTRFYTGGEYIHGLPRIRALKLGRRSLPIMARLLRERGTRRYWHQIAAGIGLFGDTAYFDTLRGFVWDRFRGPVQFDAFKALMQAQASFGPMATHSSRVRTYLESMTSDRAWDSIPWHSPPPDTRVYVAKRMEMMTIVAISYSGTEWAEKLLLDLPASQDPEIQRQISIGRSVNEEIRRKGLRQVFKEQDERGL